MHVKGSRTPCSAGLGIFILPVGCLVLGLPNSISGRLDGWMDLWQRRLMVRGAKRPRDTFGNPSVTVNAGRSGPGDFPLKSLLNLIDCKNNLAAAA